MRSLRITSAQNPPSLWICRGCLQQKVRSAWATAPFSAINHNGSKRNPRRRRIIWATVGASFVIGAIASVEDVKHGAAVVRRSARVLEALLLNVNDYRTVLKSKDGDTNEDRWQSLLKACHQRCADRTLEVCKVNGSIFIKLGQHLSSMNYLLPLEWTQTFVPLQDHCPESSYEAIEKMFIEDTGQPIAAHFDDFDRQPIGAASLAQVHLATLKDTGGKGKVAVKVQHPALKEWVPLDLALTRLTFSTLKYFFPEYDLEWLSNEMESSLPQELDFALEGQNALVTKDYFRKIKDSPLLVPDVYWGRKRILVMEYIAGHRTDDLAYLDSNGIDRDEVSAALARIFNEMIFGDTPLHCDPHGGNIAIRRNDKRADLNFDIILYDHGLYRTIPLLLRRNYAKLWLAVIDADEQGMRKYAREVANVTDDQFPLFASAITGRDYRAVTSSVVSTRSEEEKEVVSGAMGDGMLQDLVQLLGQVPRIVLLILKTNDLTRNLDESLQTREGPVRNFLILARYCSRIVFREQLDIIRNRGGILRPSNLLQLLSAWSSYLRVGAKLSLYEWFLFFRRIARLSPVASI